MTKQKTNEEIMEHELAELINYVLSVADVREINPKELATTLLAKLKVGKEKEIEKIICKYAANTYRDRIIDASKIKTAASELSTLIREEGEVTTNKNKEYIIADGEIVVWIEADGSIGNIFINQWGKKKFNLISITEFIPKKDWEKYRGKRVKLIIKEVKE